MISSSRGQSSGSSRPLKSAGTASSPSSRGTRRRMPLVATHHQARRPPPGSRRAGRGPAASAAGRPRDARPERRGDEVLVGHRDDRDADPDQAADLGGVHAPALTTVSHSTSPRSVRTRWTRVVDAGRSRHPGPLATVTPAARAARQQRVASAARGPGSRRSAGTRPRGRRSVDISGNSSWASPGRDPLQRQAERLGPPVLASSSSRRSGEQARRMPPNSTQPGSVSGSSESSRYKATEYIIIRVRAAIEAELTDQPGRVERLPAGQLATVDDQHVGHPPAGQVVGDAAPPTPPPITTIWARLGRSVTSASSRPGTTSGP